MRRRNRAGPSGPFRRSLSRELAEFEDELEKTKQHVVQLENTLRGVVRDANDISVGGPCSCGESLLLIRQRVIYCPQCEYKRTI
ncbi:hypothetical protein [Halopiger xanaduensis]|uniref:Uncharacterized protein n=1 Tax=Halopiger xanaduensis (strain DSM 18323 / JCM 14033 / SH-6) TaxID=797210 RepID=F8D5L5_HALXS|nr:hypothetical protein [Halopiger xanaduensis]AEH38853.1 hypothetical protein Halxa_4251 [Halopiger xanaduensis SH-6]